MNSRLLASETVRAASEAFMPYGFYYLWTRGNGASERARLPRFGDR
ncbi:MAG: hypothetical protein H7301_09545 [Cryobacterium sp.]|nr:hypothetical protein [Oligoflexia bacterium]